MICPVDSGPLTALCVKTGPIHSHGFRTPTGKASFFEEPTVLLSYLAPRTRLSQICRPDDLNRGAVVGNAARVEPSRGDKKVDLRPVCFETTGLDRINAHVPVKFTQFIAKCNRIPKTQRKPRCVLGRHKDVIAPGACQRIFVAQHNAVELPAATGSKMELPCWDTFLWELQRAELPFSIWLRNLSASSRRPPSAAGTTSHSLR